MTETKIQLPEEVKKDLNLHSSDELQVKIDGDRIVIEKLENIQSGQNISLRWFLVPSILASIAFFVYFKFYEKINYISFTGANTVSISTMTIVLGLLTGIISFAIFFIKGKRSAQKNLKNIYWRNFPVLLISFAVMLGMVLLAIFWLFSIIFEGAKFDIYTSTFLFFIFVAVINYLMIYFAVTITPTRIITLFTVVIIGGVFMAMISNRNLQWWHVNLSFLGTAKAASSWQFNLTLILSAFLLLTLTDYIFSILKENMPKNTGLMILHVLMTITALSLAGVGIFPNNKDTYWHVLHDKSANMLVYMIVIMIIGLRWLLPNVKKEFLTISYGIAALLVVANVLFQNVGYLSLTAFELIAFILAFAWILLLFQNLQSLSGIAIKSYDVILE
ncbi:DUF998 domain-containing protein [Floricoccus penangensis]|uniref:DUF998 domain-containing protein n=1 Tax=Floricoccus penangensis TaxID=1859475 RepID=A0A9Q5JI04_9LACT|nr:DUF998 domain-containing protein [Floricoccus penangensis]OFI47952.1 hypothetical protein BG262_00130 [Floricoccus penangensis]URZ87472.1 AbrB/MazE/SpoVT family DNA-binding domain-containing protein [Floricoccus penangensis]